MLLKDKNTIVTGANRGIGQAIVSLFAAEGANVWACARTQTDEFERFVGDLATQHKVRVEPVYFDLVDEAAVKAATKAILADKIPIDVIVNNAGAIETASFLMTPAKTFRNMMDINFISQMGFSQPLMRAMLRNKSGSVINISSSAAVFGNEGRAAYAASKAALIAATKVMARELGGVNIRVNAIAPGLTETDMMRGSTEDAAIDATLAGTALGRLGEPLEIAGAALFLASDLSSYMTGQVLSVDGGM
ncbi:SDR family NAD(P)-dependent oxidoreductase [Thalassospiraceae bacterium LMO-JJ14]|nr:SDR family NAD(P)-dependent oxidoreductase [Thalassospiraceae bacterium LMO-JJ14]